MLWQRRRSATYARASSKYAAKSIAELGDNAGFVSFMSRVRCKYRRCGCCTARAAGRVSSSVVRCASPPLRVVSLRGRAGALVASSNGAIPSCTASFSVSGPYHTGVATCPRIATGLKFRKPSVCRDSSIAVLGTGAVLGCKIRSLDLSLQSGRGGGRGMPLWAVYGAFRAVVCVPLQSTSVPDSTCTPNYSHQAGRLDAASTYG